jgi:hypothetical protein
MYKLLQLSDSIVMNYAVAWIFFSVIMRPLADCCGAVYDLVHLRNVEFSLVLILYCILAVTLVVWYYRILWGQVRTFTLNGTCAMLLYHALEPLPSPTMRIGYTMMYFYTTFHSQIIVAWHTRSIQANTQMKFTGNVYADWLMLFSNELAGTLIPRSLLTLRRRHESICSVFTSTVYPALVPDDYC